MIEVKNVNYTYMSGGPFEVAALKNVSLSLPDGEFIGLMGHTGSGKSTLVQIIGGLTKPTSGEVVIDGQTLHSKECNMREMRFKIGLVMQYPEYQLFEETVLRDISFGPENMGLSAEEVRERAELAADLVGVSRELLDKSPFDLSGGQKRRAAIAGVLAMQPKILILDEPTAGLDPAGREEILHKIRDLHKRLGITVLFVSHSMEDIASMADRIIVMNHGEAVMNGRPDEIFSRAEELREIGLSVPQITDVCDGLRKRGMPLPSGIYTDDRAFSEINSLLKNNGKGRSEC